jgi:hypothetical protein
VLSTDGKLVSVSEGEGVHVRLGLEDGIALAEIVPVSTKVEVPVQL